jgi:hypothetical protein
LYACSVRLVSSLPPGRLHVAFGIRSRRFQSGFSTPGIWRHLPFRDRRATASDACERRGQPPRRHEGGRCADRFTECGVGRQVRGVRPRSQQPDIPVRRRPHCPVRLVHDCVPSPHATEWQEEQVSVGLWTVYFLSLRGWLPWRVFGLRRVSEYRLMGCGTREDEEANKAVVRVALGDSRQGGARAFRAPPCQGSSASPTGCTLRLALDRWRLPRCLLRSGRWTSRSSRSSRGFGPPGPSRCCSGPCWPGSCCW